MKTEPALHAILDALAELIAEKLAARLGTSPSRYASAMDNPLGSPRAFLDAHRNGRFPTFKRGREVVARWCDVEAYIESRRTKPAERGVTDETSLANMALRPRLRRVK